jgi:hypothetical protein
MPEKSKGRLIYNSKFMGPEDRIKVPNIDGIFVPNYPDLDARQIIYLGLNRDPWWDIKQLLI